MTALHSWGLRLSLPLVFLCALVLVGCGKPKLVTITVEPSAAIVTVGQTVQFRAIGLDKKGKPIEGLTFAWTLDGNNGRVDTNGVFTALKPGAATVMATAETVTGTATLTIEREKVVQFATAVAPATVTVGQQTTLTIIAQNAQGQGIAGVPVAVQAVTEATQVVPANATTDASGQATFSITVARQAMANQVAIRADNQQTTVTIQGAAGAPATLQVLPSATTVPAGETVRLHMQVADASGNPVPEQRLELTALSAGTSFSTTAEATDAQGTASTEVRTSTAAGVNRLRVTVAPLPPAEVEIRGLPGSPARLTLQAESLITVAGGAVPVTVQVHDTHGNPVAQTPVQFTAAPAEAMPTATTLQTDASGTASIRLQTSPAATTNTLEAAVSGLAPVQLTVTGQPPTMLQIHPTTATLAMHGTQHFQAIISDASGHTAEVPVAWKVVGDTGTMAADGTFTATQLGPDAIMATYKELTAGAQLTVVPGEVAQVQVMPSDVTLVSGTTLQFQVVALNPHGYPLDITPLWDVANAIGTIDAAGLFTATKAGSGAVAVQVGAMTSSAPVIVTPGELATLVTSPEHIMVEAGQQVQLFASGQDAAGNPVPIAPAWHLSTNLGELTPAGEFGARVAGTGTIRVEAGARPVVTEIPVEVRPTALYRIELTPPTLTLSAGDTVTFTTIGYDIFGNAIQVTPRWELTANLGNMAADGTFVAQRVGSMVVRATVEQFTAQASVVVKPGQLASLALEPGGPLSLTAGMSVPIAVIGRDAYGHTVAVTPTWTQTPALGTLSPDGVFRAEKAGTMSLAAHSGDQQAAMQITITPGKLAAIALEPAAVTMPAGATQRFQATGLDAYDNPIPIQPVWRVADDIGEIDAAGNFSALQARPSQIIATAEGIAGSARVTVEPGPLMLLKVMPDHLQLTAGDTVPVSVVGYDALGNTLAVQPVWQVSEGVGSITPEGQLTAQRAGTGQLVVVVEALAVLVPLQVTRGAVASLSVDPPATRVTSGQQQQFTVQGFDRGGNEVPVSREAVRWDVEGGIGTIDPSGLFTATLAETGQVVARVGALQATADIRTEPGAAATLRVAPDTAVLAAGETLTLYAEAFDAVGNRVHPAVTWSVTENLGLVSATNLFQARRAGVGQLLASLGAIQQTIDVQVNAGPLAVMAIDPPQLTILAGNKIDFSATGSDAYGNAVPVTPTWSLQGNIGRIDPVTGAFQAISAGTGTVIAITGSIAALASVQVEAAAAMRLHLAPATATVAAGSTVDFTVTAFDAFNNVAPAEVTWSLTEPRGNLVDGTFQARRTGSTVVVARLGDAQAEAVVQIEPGPAIRLQVAPDWREVRAGGMRQLRAFGQDAYDNIWEVLATWELRGSIGQLTPAGRFTAEKPGTGQVMARLRNLEAPAEITVVPGPLQQLVITPANADVVTTASQQFSAVGLDAKGNAQPLPVHWAVTQGIGNLEPTGRFTAQQVGSGTVVAYTETMMASAGVQVLPGPVVLLFVTPTQTSIRAGDTRRFHVWGVDAQRNPIASIPVQWSVGGDIGTIDASTGEFTAKWLGWGKIQAAVAGIVGSADVEVQPTLPNADHSRLMTSRATVSADGKTAAEIIVLVRDRFGNPIHNAQVTLISSRNDGIEQPGPSNQQGIAIGHIRSTTPGLSDIAAVVESVRISNSLRVTFSQSGISG